MIASLLRLSMNDMARLRIKDAYSLHRIVYDLFERTRDENEKTGSGILYADKGSIRGMREILIMSDRRPYAPEHGSIETKPVPDRFLNANAYRFEIIINPIKRESASRKIIPIRGAQQILDWFAEKSPTWGFKVNPEDLTIRDMNVDQFVKNNEQITIGRATVTGLMIVTDKERFADSFNHGIGRAKTFGCGLLQLTPIRY